MDGFGAERRVNRQGEEATEFPSVAMTDQGRPHRMGVCHAVFGAGRGGIGPEPEANHYPSSRLGIGIATLLSTLPAVASPSLEGLQLVTGLRLVLLLLTFGTALGFPYFVGAFADTLFVSHLLTLAVLSEAPLQSVSARLGAFHTRYSAEARSRQMVPVQNRLADESPSERVGIQRSVADCPMSSCIRSARSLTENGLVSTAIPGSSRPLWNRALSA